MHLRTTWLVVAFGWACLPSSGFAQAQPWQAADEAGWKAYQQGRLDEADKQLRAAEQAARAFGPEDPRLATTLDHLSWVLCAEGKAAEAEPLAKSALAVREKVRCRTRGCAEEPEHAGVPL